MAQPRWYGLSVETAEKLAPLLGVDPRVLLQRQVTVKLLVG